ASSAPTRRYRQSTGAHACSPIGCPARAHGTGSGAAKARPSLPTRDCLSSAGVESTRSGGRALQRTARALISQAVLNVEAIPRGRTAARRGTAQPAEHHGQQPADQVVVAAGVERVE